MSELKLMALLLTSLNEILISAIDLSTAPMLVGNVAENALTLLAMMLVPLHVVSVVTVSIN